jgi:long-chain acyl-CoA synthetase
MTVATTLPRLLHDNARRIPLRPALREKRGGIWQVVSWAEYSALVSRIACALAAHGFGRGRRLAVIGDNRPRLYAAMLAAQSLGGAAVPLWPDAEPDRLASVLNHADVSILFAEDGEQVDKVASIKEQVPGLLLVVQTASHGMRLIGHDWLVPFEAFCVAGTAPAEQSQPADAALLLYNNDAEPSALTLSHAELLAAADALVASEDIRQTDDTVAWLPMAWFADALASALALSVGSTCNCPEHPETLRRDLREIGPTIMIAPSHVWESMFAEIETRAAHATPLKRGLFAHFRCLAERAERLRASDDDHSVILRGRLALGEVLIYAPMRDQIGLRRLRLASTGGEPLAPRVLHGLRALGVNLKQSHGVPVVAGPALEPAHA